jgi:hypothetical protein
MKHLVVLLLLSATGSALASETPEVPRPKRNVEEVIVTGYKFDKSDTAGMLMIGLSGAYLIHEYDSVRNEWRFVRASNQKKEMKNND